MRNKKARVRARAAAARPATLEAAFLTISMLGGLLLLVRALLG